MPGRVPSQRTQWWVAVACVVSLAVLERARLPAVPFVDADFWGYLGPAVHALNEGEFTHIASRQFPYPLFVYGVLRLFDSFSVIPWLQHGIGLLGGGVLLLAWMRIPIPESPTWLPRVRAGAGIFLLAAHLFLMRNIHFEHLIRPEAMSLPLGAVLVLVSVELIRVRTDPERRLRRLGLATATLVTASLLYFLRPQTALVIPAACAFVFAVLVSYRATARELVPPFLVAALLVTFTLWLPERELARDDPMSGKFLSRVLMFWHFDLAADLLEDDLERPEIEEPDAALIRDLLTAYRAELKRHRADERSYPSETFNPDRLYYGNAGRILQDRYADDREGLIAFCMETFKRGLIEHPLGYAHKVWRNLGRFYVVQDSRIYDRRMYHRMPAVLGGAKKSVTTAKEALSKHPTNRAYYEAIMAFPELPAQQPDGRVWFMGFRPVGEILSNGYRLFGNLNFPIQLALLVVICGLPRSRQHPICWIAVALSIYVLSANLTAASVHSLYTVRYIHANVSLVLFAQFAAMLFLLVSATHRPSSEEVDELPG